MNGIHVVPPSNETNEYAEGVAALRELVKCLELVAEDYTGPDQEMRGCFRSLALLGAQLVDRFEGLAP